MVLHPVYQYQLEGCFDPLVYQLRLKRCYDTIFINANWKEATTPWLISYNWKKAITPYRLVSYLSTALLPWYVSHDFSPTQFCHTHWSLILIMQFELQRLLPSYSRHCLNTSQHLSCFQQSRLFKLNKHTFHCCTLLYLKITPFRSSFHILRLILHLKDCFHSLETISAPLSKICMRFHTFELLSVGSNSWSN